MFFLGQRSGYIVFIYHNRETHLPFVWFARCPRLDRHRLVYVGYANHTDNPSICPKFKDPSEGNLPGRVKRRRAGFWDCQQAFGVTTVGVDGLLKVTLGFETGLALRTLRGSKGEGHGLLESQNKNHLLGTCDGLPFRS